MKNVEVSEVESAQTPVHILAPTPPKRRNAVFLVILAVIIAAVVIGVIIRKRGAARPAINRAASTALIRRADFIQSIRINGTVEAVNFLAIAPPRLSGPGMGTLVITKLAGSGSHVKVQQAEQSYLQAEIGYQLALAGLDHATGELLDHNRVLIDDAIH